METHPPLRARRKRLVWALPVVLALAFAGFHLWDLTLRHSGTGLALDLVDIEEARKTLAGNDGAVVIDIRLHGSPSPIDGTLRIPAMELPRRMDELEIYRDAPLFVLAATDEDAAAVAAYLARQDFNQVACIRTEDASTAQARAETNALRTD